MELGSLPSKPKVNTFLPLLTVCRMYSIVQSVDSIHFLGSPTGATHFLARNQIAITEKQMHDHFLYVRLIGIKRRQVRDT